MSSHGTNKAQTGDRLFSRKNLGQVIHNAYTINSNLAIIVSHLVIN